MKVTKFRPWEYLVDERRSPSELTNEERGVLALLDGLTAYTERCSEAYGDACAALEMGVGDLFRAARAMLNYAPDTLRRGAIDSELATLTRCWGMNPDTYEWEGRDDG